MKRLFVLALSLLLIGGISGSLAQAKGKATSTVVEILYFHGKQRCPTCIAIGDNSKDIVNKVFAKQVKAGQVRFREIDISTAEGEKIADRYRVTWSSLFVNQWKGKREQRNDLTRFGFENARSNPQAFRTGLKNKITQLLK